MIGLILANDVQLAGHALAMLWLFVRRVGSLRGQGVGETLLKSLLASGVMGGATYGAIVGLARFLPARGVLSWALTVAAGGLVGLGTYVAMAALLRVRELEDLRTLIGRALGRAPG